MSNEYNPLTMKVELLTYMELCHRFIETIREHDLVHGKQDSPQLRWAIYKMIQEYRNRKVPPPDAIEEDQVMEAVKLLHNTGVEIGARLEKIDEEPNKEVQWELKKQIHNIIKNFKAQD